MKRIVLSGLAGIVIVALGFSSPSSAMAKMHQEMGSA